MQKNFKKEIEEESFKWSELYLLGYNSFQAFGWSYIALLSFRHLLMSDKNDILFDKVILSLIVFQTLAVFEVFHAMVGLVRSSALITAFQIASRVFLVYAVLLASPSAQRGTGFVLVLAAWTITEIIRYSFYCTSILNITPKFLTFLRYTLFLGLYPMGVTGELMCIYRLAVSDSEVFDYLLPNVLNFHFSYFYFLHFVFVAYILVFPQMYGHMKRQRKKVLGTQGASKDQ